MVSRLFQNSNFYFRGLLEDLNGEAEKRRNGVEGGWDFRQKNFG
jgi:hypothetical protein